MSACGHTEHRSGREVKMGPSQDGTLGTERAISQFATLKMDN